jgi:dTDP-4-dehydrorhamnose reductase
MLRVLVMGGSGMLGHRMLETLSGRYPTYATFRGGRRPSRETGDFFSGFDAERLIPGVDARRFDTVEACLDRVRPDVVVNCIGLVKQLPEGSDPVVAVELNSLFPRRLAGACVSRGLRLVHVSTDCVFSGARGNYAESDPPDARDLYGLSKLLGEPSGPGCVTLRTSIIGRELSRTTGLLEWVLSRRGDAVNGYSNAFWSGLTTEALSKVVSELIAGHSLAGGLYHVSSEPVSKFGLIVKINEALGLGMEVTPVQEPREDRTLDSRRFRTESGIQVPGLDGMIEALRGDLESYDEWRGRHGATAG